MASTSLDRMLNASRLASPASGRAFVGRDALIADRSIRLTRADADRLEGKVKDGRARANQSGAKPAGLSRKLEQRAHMLRHDRQGGSSREAMSFDARQRAVVKIHYFNHGSGGGAALKAHARYVARDAAVEGRETPGPEVEPSSDRDNSTESEKAHAQYLSRGGREGFAFYDATGEQVDGAALAADWAARDKRHFRLILSAERGERLADMPAYTRELMARAEAQLGTKLQWVAVDHHDTDNPHTHLILRGRRANGQDLILPKDFIRHGLRDIARDVATEWLGARSPEDARLALESEVSRHAPTRLDRMIANQLPDDGRVRVSSLEDPHGDRTTSLALKARAGELKRLGLATEVKRNVLALQPDWQEQLQAMELHLNVRKAVMMERTAQRHAEFERSMKRLGRGLLGR